jgi:antitoxin CptB
MINNLDFFKKKLIYRASYRGTKEVDILLGSFVNKHINKFDKRLLLELEKFLNFEDEIILNYYQNNVVKNNIDKNEVSIMFKKYKI